MTKLICFLGCIGSGKDYRASKLVKEQNFVQVNFADKVYEMVGNLLGIDLSDRNIREYWKKQEIVTGKKKLTFRQFVQNIGTEMRKKDENYRSSLWFDEVYGLLSNGKSVCCSDLRFVNELKEAMSFNDSKVYFGQIDIEFIFCDYRSNRYDNNDKHESEKLAQCILKSGKKDGEVLNSYYLNTLCELSIC